MHLEKLEVVNQQALIIESDAQKKNARRNHICATSPWTHFVGCSFPRLCLAFSRYDRHLEGVRKAK
jgi:hypothetical protein